MHRVDADRVLAEFDGEGAHQPDRAADVDGDDVGTLFGQPSRVTAALTARRTGDERNLALYSPRHGPARSPRSYLIDRSGAVT
jgi:hypothetical protein